MDCKNILVIGACNIDIQGFSINNFDLYNSNIGKIEISYGGVGRNIAVNLNKLDKNVKILTVLSDDQNGKNTLEDLKKRKLDCSDILIKKASMSTYLSIFDTQSEMIAAIADMEILNYLSKDYLETKKSIIQDSKYIVMDVNLQQETIEYLASIIDPKTCLIVDTVSIEKAKRITNILDKIGILKTNKLELESLLAKPIKTKSDIEKACDILLEKGVKKVFVSLGANGVIFADKSGKYSIENPKNIEIVDVNGAGDIFTSALVYAEKKGLDIQTQARFSILASVYKISKKGTSPKDFSLDKMRKLAEKHYPEMSKGEYFYE